MGTVQAAVTVDVLPKPIVDFRDYIADRAHGFVGRDWVFEAVQSWLINSNESRFFSITGEPGSGKTAISARLAQFSSGKAAAPAKFASLQPGFLSAAHFFWARDTLWIDPLTFCRSIAMQLATRYPEFMTAVVEENNDGQVRIELKQIANRVDGQMIGMVFPGLTLGQLSPQDAFNRVVRAPLERFLQDRPNEKLVILLDALDESLIQTRDLGIVDLLSRSAALPQNVRFILTSRPDPRVTNPFSHPKRLYLSSDEYATRNRNDLRSYVATRLQNEKLIPGSDLDSARVKTTVDKISGKADDNFQYARLLIDDLAACRRSIDDLDSLPAGLNRLYYDSLDRTVKLSGKTWSTQYAPVIGALTVARTALGIPGLMSFSSLPDSVVSECLNELRQYLQITTITQAKGPDEKHYSLFHQSFIDMLQVRYLPDDDEFPNTFYLPPIEQHRRIANAYLRNAASWSAVDWTKVDDYGLEFLSSHLFGMSESREGRESLYDLICCPLMKHKRAIAGHHRLFLLDVELAMMAARSEKPRNRLQVARCSQIIATLSSTVGDLPPTLFGAMTRCGYGEYALELAQLIPKPKYKAEAFLGMAEAFLEKSATDAARGALLTALTNAEWYQLPPVGQLLARVDQFDRIVPLVLGSEECEEIVRRLVLKLLAGQKAAEIVQLSQALQTEGKLTPELAWTVHYCATQPAPDVAASTPEQRVRGMANAAAALWNAGNAERAQALAGEAVSALAETKAGWSMFQPLCIVAPVLSPTPDFARVVEAAQRIGEESLKSDLPTGSSPPAKEPGTPSDEYERATSLIQTVQQQVSAFMAMKFTRDNLVAQGPDASSIRIIGHLGPDEVGANALSWIAQTLANSEPPPPVAATLPILAALDSLKKTWVGASVLGYLALVCARAGDEAKAGELVDLSIGVLNEVPAGPNHIEFVLGAAVPCMALIGQLERAFRIARFVLDAAGEKNQEAAKEKQEELLLKAGDRLRAAGKMADALSFVRLIENRQKRERLLCSVSEASSQLKDTGTGLRVLFAIAGGGDNFLKSADLPAPARLRVEAQVAEAASKLGRTDFAMNLAGRIIEVGEHPEPESNGRCMAMIRMARALTAVTAVDRVKAIVDAALVISSRVSDQEIQVEVHGEAARVLAEAGFIEPAIDTAKTIGDEWKNKAYVLAEIVRATAKSGNLERARTILATIRLREAQADAIGSIAEQQLETSPDLAANMAEAALTLTVPRPKDEQPRPGEPSRLTGEYMEGALRPGPGVRAGLLSVLYRAGRRDSALAAAEEDLKSESLPVAAEAAGFLLEAGQTGKGLATLDSIQSRLQNGLPLNAHSGRVLALVALVLARAKQFDRARTAAEAIAANPPPSQNPDMKDGYVAETWKTLALISIARCLFDMGDRPGASEVCELAVTSWSTMVDPRNRSRSTGNVINMLQHLHLTERALVFWETALETEYTKSRYWALNAIGAGAPALAAVDGGESLWQLYQSFRETEVWWEPEHAA
jgi:tetratricopeptide (TPR) repeat protein